MSLQEYRKQKKNLQFFEMFRKKKSFGFGEKKVSPPIRIPKLHLGFCRTLQAAFYNDKGISCEFISCRIVCTVYKT